MIDTDKLKFKCPYSCGYEWTSRKALLNNDAPIRCPKCHNRLDKKQNSDGKKNK